MRVGNRPKEKEWLKKMLNIRMVIIEVQPGETEEEAWSRHLTDCPEDLYANIRVFNRPPRRLSPNLSSP
jgi:hypothetical protein